MKIITDEEDEINRAFLKQWAEGLKQKGCTGIHIGFAPGIQVSAIRPRELRAEIVEMVQAPEVPDPELI